MTEEQIKFWFNSMYRLIVKATYDRGITFGELVDWAKERKVDDNIFLSMIDQMEIDNLVIRRGERYTIPVKSSRAG